jgi:hypothetical protein
VVALIEQHVASILDKKAWKARDKEEKEARGQLYNVAQNWEEAVKAVA